MIGPEPTLPEAEPAARQSSTDRAGFRRLWLQFALTTLARSLTLFGLPLVALELTTSPAAVAGVARPGTISWLVFALPVGLVVDRAGGRALVAGSLGLGVALLVFAIVVAADAHQLWMVYAVAVIVGLIQSLIDTGTWSLVPGIVGRDQYTPANIRLAVTENTAQVAAPAIGGALLWLGSAALLGTAAGASFTGAASLGKPGRERSGHPAGAIRASGWSDIAAGFRFLLSDRLLRSLAGFTAATAVLWSALTAVLVVFAVEPGPLALSEAGYGVLVAGIGIGSMLGSAVVGRLARRVSIRLLLSIDLAATVTVLAVPALSSRWWIVAAALILGGFGAGLWRVISATLRQLVAPRAMLGRVHAATRFVSFGTMPIGAALGGIAAEHFGVESMYGGAAVLGALFLAWFLVGFPRDLPTIHGGDLPAAGRRD